MLKHFVVFVFTDLNCGEVYDQGLGKAISQGKTTEALLDASIELSMGLLLKAGYFDPLSMVPHASITPGAVGTAASHELAHGAALQGMVLLRNEKQALPLKRGAGVKTAVLGPLANITLGLMARYYDAVCPGPLNPEIPWGQGMRPSACITAPLHALMSRGKVLHASGTVCPADRPGNHCLKDTSTAAIPAAVKAAKQADQIVMFVGTDVQVEKEGTDRQTLTLPGSQPALLQAVREAAPDTPLVVVLLNGGAVAMNYSGADAVVEAFFPGIQGAEAIACALYGEEGCNRWGRLPVTVYPESFALQNDMANFGISTGGSGQRTYKYYTDEFGEPLFPFGHGLSLVPFTMEWSAPPPATPSQISLAKNATISVTVTNAGSREGDTVVMLYHTPNSTKQNGGHSLLDLDPAMPVPNARLVGYRRISLDAGASADLAFTVTADDLALVDNNGDTQLFAGTHGMRVWQGNGQDLHRKFQVPNTAMLRELQW
jgi:beta-D-xylosidase 4